MHMVTPRNTVWRPSTKWAGQCPLSDVPSMKQLGGVIQVKDAMQQFASKVAGESSKPKVIDETVLVSPCSPDPQEQLCRSR